MKKTLKLLGAGYAMGLLTLLLVMLYLGGDNLTQAGIRLSAVEQGFSLASRHWQYDAVPAHEETVQVAISEMPKVPAKKGAKR